MAFLVDKGADVNAQNAFGSTALIWSATDLAKVRFLTEHGAKRERRDQNRTDRRSSSPR